MEEEERQEGGGGVTGRELFAFSRRFNVFNPGPERRVPSPNRYIADAKFCFCKNTKRIIIIKKRALRLSQVVQRPLRAVRGSKKSKKSKRGCWLGNTGRWCLFLLSPLSFSSFTFTPMWTTAQTPTAWVDTPLIRCMRRLVT